MSDRHQIVNKFAEWYIQPETQEVIVTPDFTNACLTRDDLVKMLAHLDAVRENVHPDLIEVKTKLKESVGGQYFQRFHPGLGAGEGRD